MSTEPSRSKRASNAPLAGATRVDAGARPLIAHPVEGVELEAVEKDLVRKALAKADNNKVRAAKRLGVSRGQLYSLLKRHGLCDARR